MNYVENPIRDLHECMAHAQYQGFSDIEYASYDHEAMLNAKTPEARILAKEQRVKFARRPTTRDFCVFAMFAESWPSTALGHGGMGGSSMTDAYTIILECNYTSEFLVYFGGQFCYRVGKRSKNVDLFLQDCSNRRMKTLKESTKYNES
jgi:hypothetical protein